MVLFEAEENGIGSIVAKVAHYKPNKIAIISDEITISYKHLHLEAQLLCCELREAGIAYEDIVGICTGHGIEHIIAQLAVVYAGGTCLPLDPALPEADIQARLAFVKPKYLVVDDTNNYRVGFEGSLFHLDISKHRASQSPSTNYPEQAFLPRDTPSDFRSHVLFSSGTTGVPKAIQILGRGILRVARDELWGQCAIEEKFGHINSTSFDASLIDIWVALLLGATIVVVDRQELLNPIAFAKTLAEKDITTLTITSSLFSKIATFSPKAFSKCQTVIVCGELPSIGACKSVLQMSAPKRLINGYGPTECSIVSFVHILTQEDLEQGRMPLGRPVHQTDAYILDVEGKPVTSPGSGELWLGGPGLAPGYLFDHDKTSEVFLSVVHPHDPRRHIRLYRTGDKVDVYDDYMSWAGRKNREIKINGHRVQLDVLKMELMQTNLIEKVAAMRYSSPFSNTDYLIACIAYKNGQQAFGTLLAEARRRLPRYMVPEFIEFDELPLNTNGKIDHKKTLKSAQQKLQERHARILVAKSPEFQGLTATEKVLKQLWAQILISVPTEMINNEGNFFLLGGTSLSVAALTGYIQQAFGVDLPTDEVYKNPLLKDQAAAIQKLQYGQKLTCAKPVTVMMQEDAKLFSDRIKFPSSTAAQWKDGRNVFLTGATGFVGPFLLQELLKAPEVKKVCCLVRADTDDQAFKRLWANLKRYGLCFAGSLKSKLEVIPGDFSQPMLGLETIAYRNLADQTDVIYHLGAQVDYTQSYTSHVGSNVIGTHHLLKFACYGHLKPFHYISSISAFGPTGLMKKDGLLDEDGSLESYLEPALRYENGYGQSQWVADEMVSRLMRRGFPAAIYRLGFVLCNSTNGMGNPDDFMGRLLSDCAKLHCYPLLPNQRKELIAVDNVATILKAISMSDQNLGHAYHITPDIGQAIEVVDLFELVGKLCGIEMKGLQYADWSRELKTAPRNASLRLFPLLPMLEEVVHGNKTRWELYEGMARFNVENTLRALEGAGVDAGILAPVPNEALERYLIDCLEINHE